VCGRYTLVRPETAADRFGFVDFHDTRITPRFNISPTENVLTVVDDHGQRALVGMRWGYRPPWLPRDLKQLAPINAKAETLARSGLFRSALATGRCLVPADGFYEWRTLPGVKKKEPVHIRLKGGGLFAFAGIWVADREGLATCAIVTTRPNDLIQPIHDRMPVILAPDAEALWVDLSVSETDAVSALLTPISGEELELQPLALGVDLRLLDADAERSLATLRLGGEALAAPPGLQQARFEV
jgi:putative SOS response-associated peptidase YedK